MENIIRFSKVTAINSLEPTASAYGFADSPLYPEGYLGNRPTDAEIKAEISRLQTEYDNNQYQRDRQYPAIGDQLDALFHAGVFPAEMAAEIQAVKDANPKPV